MNEINKPEDFENERLYEIDCKIQEFSEMSLNQRLFLNGLIRQLKPKKILEVGISAGASSSIILNAIKDIDGSKLYSIDYNKNWYRDDNKLSGFLVQDNFSNLKDKWVLYTGGVAAKFMEEIGYDIDFCLLDTMHCNPGEFLDFLMILPFLKKNAVIVIHDLILHTSVFGDYNYYQHTTNCILYSAINGKKILLEKDNHYYKEEKYYAKMIDISGIPNIGAIILDDNIKDNALDIFMLLSLHWMYKITEEDYLTTLNLFIKYYPSKLVNIFERIYLFNKNYNHNANEYISENTILINKTNLLDLLFSIEETKEYKRIIIFGIKITLKKKKI